MKDLYELSVFYLEETELESVPTGRIKERLSAGVSSSEKFVEYLKCKISPLVSGQGEGAAGKY